MATIGLRNVHYSLLVADTAEGATYGAPIKVPGAISANVNPNSAIATLFADDGPSDVAATLGEIALELNLADIPLLTQSVWFGHQYLGGMLIKKSTDKSPWLALGYMSLKSNGSYRYTWLLKGKFSVPEEENETKGDSVNFKTPTAKGTFVKRDYDDSWQLVADSDGPYAGSIATWFTAVPTPPAVCVVTFAVTPDTATVEMFNTGAPVHPNPDGTYSLAAGAYTYSLHANGYVAQSAIALTIAAGDVTTGTKTVTVVMVAG